MRRALAFCALVALGGCAMVGPDYQRPASPLPSSYPEPATLGEATVPRAWWSLYGDATLDELVRAGFERNADVAIAAARVEEAEAALRETRAVLFFPIVEGDAGATRSRTAPNGTNRTNGTTTELTLGLATSFEVDLWGRLRRAERSVQAELLASRYARDTVGLTLAATIARTYFAIRSLDTQVVASQEILAAADESVGIARKRLDAGVASALDVYQAGSLRTAASAQTKEFARQRAVALHQLAALTGRLDLALPPLDIARLPIPAVPAPGLPSTLLERRPDLLEAEQRLSAATERIGVARASQLPALRLTGSVGFESLELDSLVSSGSRIWSIGAGLLGPIIDGGRYAARTAQAEAQAKQAEAAYRKTVESAFREVADSLSNMRLSAETETDLQQRVVVAREAVRLARMRYDRGYSGYLEVLDASRILNESQLLFIRNRQARLSYTVDFMNALGGGWSES